MEIRSEINDNELILYCNGFMDTSTAPCLYDAFLEHEEAVNSVVFDFTELSYTSSAGIRTALNVYKDVTARGGSFKIRNANETVKEVFDMVGLLDLMDFE